VELLTPNGSETIMDRMLVLVFENELRTDVEAFDKDLTDAINKSLKAA